MAGYRRTRGGHAAEATGQTTVAEARRVRIEERMRARYAQAQNGAQRLAVMSDYVRAAASGAARADPVRTEHTLDELVRRLRRAGDELLRMKSTGGTR
jgi:hypothetical protein